MIKNIYTVDFLELIKTSSIRLIDVREEDEYLEGHIPGAIHSPLSRFHDAKLPQDCDLIFYCRSGYRSQIAIEYYYSHRALNEAERQYYDYKDGYLGYIRHLKEAGL